MKNVIFNHDAAIDEYMASVLISTMADVNLLGVIITNGDCVYGPAMSAAYKIQQYIGQPNTPLLLSSDRGWNSFPWAYREDCIRQGEISCLVSIPNNPNWPWYPSSVEKLIEFNPNTNKTTEEGVAGYPDGNVFLANALDNALLSGEKITLVICCPLTILKSVLSEKLERENAIDELIWMGGAIAPVKGNLDPSTISPVIANPWAEWNAFWDSSAVDWVFKNTNIPITVFPLNVTNQAKITTEFKNALAAQANDYPLSTLAHQSYSLVDGQSFYEMWDVLTVSYLARPDLFSAAQSMELSIVTQGFYEGTLYPSQENSRTVSVILNLAQPAAFYDYVLTAFRR